MQTPNHLTDELVSSQHLSADLRLEVLANEMMNQGIHEDQILVTPMGGFYRGFRRDVSEVNVMEDSLGAVMYYQIKTSRDGIYDGLPENIFHDNLEDILAGKSIDPIENVKKNRREEEAARRFFQVVEKEIYRLKILFEKEERKSIIGSSQFYRHEIFLRLWNELENLDGQYLTPLMQILPLACKFHGDLRAMEVFLSYLLEIDVRIECKFKENKPVLVDQPCTLGDTWLGNSSVLGGCFYDFDPHFDISIGPLSVSSLELYMPGGKARVALQIFIDYFFLLNSQVEFNYFMEKTQNTVILEPVSANFEEEARLGISSFL